MTAAVTQTVRAGAFLAARCSRLRCSPRRRRPRTADRAFRATADGKPDFSGIWQSTERRRLRPRAACGPRRCAAGPGRRRRRRDSVPAGGARARRANFAARATADPRGSSATRSACRARSTIPAPFQIFQRARDLTLVGQFGAVRTIHTNGTQHPEAAVRLLARRFARALGGRHARRRRRRLQRRDLARPRRQLPQRRAARRRALDAARREHDRVPRDDRGPEGVHAAVELERAPASASRARTSSSSRTTASRTSTTSTIRFRRATPRRRRARTTDSSARGDPLMTTQRYCLTHCARSVALAPLAARAGAEPVGDEGRDASSAANGPGRGCPTVSPTSGPLVEHDRATTTTSPTRKAASPATSRARAAAAPARIGTVERRAARAPSRVSDPPDGQVPFQPWARAVQQDLLANFFNPTERGVHRAARALRAGGAHEVVHVARLRDPPVPGLRAVPVRFRHAHHSSRRQAAPAGRHQALERRFARPLGRQHARRRRARTTTRKARLARTGEFASENVRDRGALHLRQRRRALQLRGRRTRIRRSTRGRGR